MRRDTPVSHSQCLVKAKKNSQSVTSDLMHADVTLVAEHHLVVVLAVGRLAHVAHHVLVILDAQPLLRLHSVRHVFVAAVLELLHHPLHGDLVQRRQGCGKEERGQIC